MNEGHVFRKLNVKAAVFIEYAPLETAWVPIIGCNYYLYILFMGFGFEVIDTTDNGYELLAISFDGTTPKFAQNVKKQEIENKELNYLL